MLAPSRQDSILTLIKGVHFIIFEGKKILYVVIIICEDRALACRVVLAIAPVKWHHLPGTLEVVTISETLPAPHNFYSSPPSTTSRRPARVGGGGEREIARDGANRLLHPCP